MLQIVKSFLSPRERPQTGVVTGKYYERTGECNGCGKCCTDIYLIHHEQMITDHAMFEDLKRKFPDYESFIPVEQTEEGLVFKCANLLPDNTCADYENRPDFCRNYPSEHTLLLGGKLSDECSYSFRLLRSFQTTLAEAARKGKLGS